MQHGRAQDRLAFDFASVRRVDADGHLHVEVANISAATVNDYLGSEIPNAAKLGFDPNRMYRLYRDPAELKKAADSFHNKPLLTVHKQQAAYTHDHELTVGAVSNPKFTAPFLKAELVVWDAAAIAGIESGAQRQLSSSYRYTCDPTPGVTPDGTPYDAVMRNIVANHVALVETGRVGTDCIVGDAAPAGSMNGERAFNRRFPSATSVRRF